MQVLKSMFRQPAALFGLVVVALVVMLAVAAPLVAPYSPDEQMFDGLTLEGAPLPPSAQFLLGTDTLGRDLFSRLLYGARTSLVIGLVANGVAVSIGLMIGILSGYMRGLIGNALMRPSLWIVAMVIALVNWVQVARIVYTETRGLVERDFILAERSLGAGHGRILFHHILPHLVPTAIVWGTLGIATTVLLEATLSFLGIGVQPPTPSWGNIIFESQSYFQAAPWLVFIPGAVILLTALSFNLVGDALRDILDPTQRGRG